MTEYYDTLTEAEQEELKEIIRLLFRQTYLLEKKFDRRAGRMMPVKEYREAELHLEFLKTYFRVAGITLCQNMHMGVIYIQDEMLWGEKLPRLATIYLLVLKLLYDEQMAAVSSDSHVAVTLGMLNSKAGEFHVLNGVPSPTEMRRALGFLKRYQIVEPLDVLEEMDENMRLIIYPCIHAVVTGDSIRELLNTFSEEEDCGDETAVQGTIEDLSE